MVLSANVLPCRNVSHSLRKQLADFATEQQKPFTACEAAAAGGPLWKYLLNSVRVVRGCESIPGEELQPEWRLCCKEACSLEEVIEEHAATLYELSAKVAIHSIFRTEQKESTDLSFQELWGV